MAVPAGSRPGFAGTGGLPAETRTYVLAITGAPAEDWRVGAGVEMPAQERDVAGPAAKPEPEKTCLQVTALLRIPSRGDRFAIGGNEGPAAPWGIQLAGNFSKALALQSFGRA